MLIAKVDAEQVHGRLPRCPIAYREPLVLREIEGLSYQEISSVMSVPIGTVMSRFARGAALLVSASTWSARKGRDGVDKPA